MSNRRQRDAPAPKYHEESVIAAHYDPGSVIAGHGGPIWKAPPASAAASASAGYPKQATLPSPSQVSQESVQEPSRLVAAAPPAQLKRPPSATGITSSPTKNRNPATKLSEENERLARARRSSKGSNPPLLIPGDSNRSNASKSIRPDSNHSSSGSKNIRKDSKHSHGSNSMRSSSNSDNNNNNLRSSKKKRPSGDRPVAPGAVAVDAAQPEDPPMTPDASEKAINYPGGNIVEPSILVQPINTDGPVKPIKTDSPNLPAHGGSMISTITPDPDKHVRPPNDDSKDAPPGDIEGGGTDPWISDETRKSSRRGGDGKYYVLSALFCLLILGGIAAAVIVLLTSGGNNDEPKPSSGGAVESATPTLWVPTTAPPEANGVGSNITTAPLADSGVSSNDTVVELEPNVDVSGTTLEPPPTNNPTRKPAMAPTPFPTTSEVEAATTTAAPMQQPSPAPTKAPVTEAPTEAPVAEVPPSLAPTQQPTPVPSKEPTAIPSSAPTSKTTPRPGTIGQPFPPSFFATRAPATLGAIELP